MSDNKEEAYKPFENLKKRFEEVAESLGLQVENMMFFLNEDHMVNVVWTITPEAVMTEAEKDQRRVDKEFKDMMGGMSDPFADKAADAKADLKKWLEENG